MTSSFVDKIEAITPSDPKIVLPSRSHAPISHRMPGAAQEREASADSRAKAFKNKGKDNEVRIVPLFPLEYSTFLALETKSIDMIVCISK